MRAKKMLLSFMLLPIIIPHVITAIAMYFLTARFGLVGNVVWIGLCHAVVALPIVLLILLSSMQAVDINLERAAPQPRRQPRSRLQARRDSARASRASCPRRCSPSSRPSTSSSSRSSSPGVRAQTLPVRIWNSLHLELEPVIAAVSAFLIAVTGVVLLLDGGGCGACARSFDGAERAA